MSAVSGILKPSASGRTKNYRKTDSLVEKILAISASNTSDIEYDHSSLNIPSNKTTKSNNLEGDKSKINSQKNMRSVKMSKNDDTKSKIVKDKNFEFNESIYGLEYKDNSIDINGATNILEYDETPQLEVKYNADHHSTDGNYILTSHKTPSAFLDDSGIIANANSNSINDSYSMELTNSSFDIDPIINISKNIQGKSKMNINFSNFQEKHKNFVSMIVNNSNKQNSLKKNSFSKHNTYEYEIVDLENLDQKEFNGLKNHEKYSILNFSKNEPKYYYRNGESNQENNQNQNLRNNDQVNYGTATYFQRNRDGRSVFDGLGQQSFNKVKLNRFQNMEGSIFERKIHQEKNLSILDKNKFQRIYENYSNCSESSKLIDFNGIQNKSFINSNEKTMKNQASSRKKAYFDNSNILSGLENSEYRDKMVRKGHLLDKKSKYPSKTRLIDMKSKNIESTPSNSFQLDFISNKQDSFNGKRDMEFFELNDRFSNLSVDCMDVQSGHISKNKCLNSFDITENQYCGPFTNTMNNPKNISFEIPSRGSSILYNSDKSLIKNHSNFKKNQIKNVQDLDTIFGEKNKIDSCPWTNSSLLKEKESFISFEDQNAENFINQLQFSSIRNEENKSKSEKCRINQSIPPLCSTNFIQKIIEKGSDTKHKIHSAKSLDSRIHSPNPGYSYNPIIGTGISTDIDDRHEIGDQIIVDEFEKYPKNSPGFRNSSIDTKQNETSHVSSLGCSTGVQVFNIKCDPKYKSEICRNYEKYGMCSYGNKCQFAHGQVELRHVNKPEKYKTKPCIAYHIMGSCNYGKRCNFLHDEVDMIINKVSNRSKSFKEDM